jgi:hypothetical protein
MIDHIRFTANGKTYSWNRGDDPTTLTPLIEVLTSHRDWLMSAENASKPIVTDNEHHVFNPKPK